MERASDLKFVGMNTRDDPERLSPGVAQEIRNALISGEGSLETRNGFEGLFTTPLPGPIYEPIAFEQETGTTWIVFASGGKLWKTEKDTNIYDEIRDFSQVEEEEDEPESFNFAHGGRDVRMVRYGRYIYGVDGFGPLFRTNLSIGEIVAGLDAPTVAPVVRPSTTPLDSATATDWSSQPDPDGTSQRLLNSSFELGNGGPTHTVITNWSTAGVTDSKSASVTDGLCVPIYGSYALLLDESGNAASQSVDAVTLNAPLPPSVANKTRVYGLRAAFHQANASGLDLINVTVEALNSVGESVGPLRDKTFTYPKHVPNQWAVENWFVAFNGLTPDPVDIRVTLAAGENNNAGNASMYCDFIELYPLVHKLVVADGATVGTFDVRMLVTNPGNGNASVPEAYRATAGLWIRREFGGGDEPDWSDVFTVSLPITYPDAILAGGNRPRLRLGIQETGSTTIHWTNQGAYSLDGATVAFDLTTIDSENRDTVQYYYVQILDDLDAATDTGLLFTMGTLANNGALGIGYGYYWRFSEWSAVNGEYPSGDGIESSGSPLSREFVASVSAARTELTLPEPINDDTTHFLVWRQGGVFASDGFARLVGVVPRNANLDSPDGFVWLFNDRKFYDSVPDSLLFGRTVYQINRDNFPSGGIALCIHQSRLWIAKGNEVYASWLLTSAESGLYTSNATDPDDPSLPIKGARLALASNLDSDIIQSLVAFGTMLVVPRNNSVSLINGYSPENFAGQSYLASSGLGCRAKRAAGIVVTPNGNNEAWFLSASGLMAFTGDLVSPRSVELEGVLRADLLFPPAYAGCSLVLHDRRVWLFAPGNRADTGNTAAYIFDSRTGGWTKADNANFTSAVSLSGDADGQDLYLAGIDGQLYRYSGFADKATPDGAEQGITFTYIGRRIAGTMTGVGQEVKALELWARVCYAGGYHGAEAGTTLALSVQGDDYRGTPPGSGNLWQGQTVAYRGERQFRKRVGSQARGRSLAVTVETNVRQPFALRSIELDYSVGTRVSRGSR